jgi:hypothetical protein
MTGLHAWSGISLCKKNGFGIHAETFFFVYPEATVIQSTNRVDVMSRRQGLGS